MKSTYRQFISVACVMLMVMTAFHVMTSGAEATDLPSSAVEGGGDSSASIVVERDVRRLTLSDDGSDAVDVAISYDGERHMVWIEGGRSVMHKSSIDSGATYSSDESITQSFSSVDEVRVACSASTDLMAVVLEATTVDHEGPQIILVASDGSDWDSAVRLAEGHSPSVAIVDDDVFVGFTEGIDGEERFSIVSIDPDGNAERLLSIPADDACGRIVTDGTSVHYALTANVGEKASVVYGCIDSDGKSISEPTVMRSMVETRDVSIAMDGDLPVVAWAGDDGRAGVFVATTASKSLYWNVQTLDADAPSDVSIAACDGTYVAWTSSAKSASDVHGAHIADDGTVSLTTLSTDGVDAWAPVAFVDGGEVSCMWTEADRSASEIMVEDDILNASPDIEDLIEICEEMDDSLFLTKDSRSHLVDRLEEIVTLQAESKDLEADIAISSVVRSLEGDDSIDGYEQYLNKLSKSEDKMAKELTDGLRGNMRDDGSDVTIKSLPDPFNPGGYVPQGYKLFLLFEEAVGQGTAVTVSWHVASDCGIVVQNRVYYGISSVYENVVYGSGTENPSITITGLSPGQMYKFMPGSKNQVDDWYDGVTLECNTTIPPLQVSDISSTVICPHETKVTWSTNYVATSIVNYGLSTSYGSTEFESSGTSHSVTLTDLQPGTTYHYCVKSVSTSPSGICTSADRTFTTMAVDDADSGTDAGGTIGTAIGITPGEISGRLCAHDVSDHFTLTLASGQTVSATLDDVSGVSIILRSPDGTTFATSEEVSGVERLDAMTDESGQWYIELHLDSGDGGTYTLGVSLLVGHHAYHLDVGAAGDMSVQGNLPGLSLVNGTGWSDPTASPSRDAIANSSFLLNVPEGSFNVNADHLVTLSYNLASDVQVEVLCNDVWVSVTEVPDTTTRRSFSFVLDHSLISDSDGSSDGINVRMRFNLRPNSSVEVFTIGALMLNFASDLSSSSGSMIVLDSGWTEDNGIWNGTSGATIVVTIPDVTNGYMLEFNYLNDTDGMGVQQMTSSGYESIGSIVRHGTGAVILLSDDYYDDSTSTESMDVRLRITGPMYNLTSVTLRPTTYYDDVGTEDDASEAANTPGLRVLDNGEWYASTVVDGRTVRRSSTQYANFVLDSPVSDCPYIISITYRSASDVTIRQYISGTQIEDLITLPYTGTGWDTVSFETNVTYHDFFEGDQIDVLFEVGAANVYIDSMSASVDTDGDGISDHEEALRHVTVANPTVIPLDPFSADTDADGVDDSAELDIGTDPCDADTDDDGLIDGSEKWSQTWSTEGMTPIPAGGYEYVVLNLPAISDYVTSAILSYGIQHPDENGVEVHLRKSGDTTIHTLYDPEGTASDSCIFQSFDILNLDSSFTGSTFFSATTWNLKVQDTAYVDEGVVQYFHITLYGDTDPLEPDTDGDGITDGEEVDLGTDGWETNPMLVDTDGDGVNDGDEVSGSTPCGEPTDPTRFDTDDDGFNDGVDLALGDMVVKIGITEFTPYDTIYLGWFWYNNDPRAFFTISAANYCYSTAWVQTHKGESTPINDRYYYVDVHDSNTSLTAEIAAWAENPSDGTPVSDVRFDINPSSQSLVVNPTFSLTGPVGQVSEYQFIGDGDNRAHVTITFEKVILGRTDAIVVNGTYEDQQGLYDDGTNLRYTEDDQVYVVYMNCSSAYGVLEEGLNTVILPRSVAVRSQLNDVLTGEKDLAGTPLNGANFYAYDGSESSSHVIAAITVNVTGYDGMTLLGDMTMNSTSSIATHRTVDSEQLCMLHLPHDVLCAVPLEGIDNSPTFRAPSVWQEDFIGTIVDAGTFMYHALMDAVTFMVDTATSLAVFALEAIATITNVVCQDIIDAANVIVDAFDALVDWAAEFIQATIDIVFGPIIEVIQDAVDAYCMGLASAWSRAIDEYDRTGDVSSETISVFGSALRGDLFWILFGLTMAIDLVLMAVTATTNVFGFLLNVAVSLIIGVVVSEAFLSEPSQGTNSLSKDSAPDGSMDLMQFESELGASGVDNSTSTWSTVWGAFGCLAATFALTIGYGAWHDGACSRLGKLSLVLGALALGVATTSIGVSDPMVSTAMSLTSAAMGVLGIYFSFAELTEVQISAKATAWFSIIVSAISIAVTGVGIYVSIEDLCNSEV